MNQLVFIQNNEVVTDSIMIAEMFEKRHDIVLRDIRQTMNSVNELSNDENVKELGIDMGILKFVETQYTNKQNKQSYPKFLLNFDAFMLVTMSYTTQKAMLVKVKYINEFNRMQQELKKQNVPKTQLEILQGTINQLVEQEQRVSKLEADVSNISNIVTMNSDEWREKVKVILNKIAKNWTGIEPYKSVRNLSYERLERRAGCNLEVRLNNRKKRAIAKGMSKTFVNKINKLDVISEEKRLVEIYIQVVKEMAIEHKVNINDFKFEEVI
ncbi:Rha family transcriptional regulator [Gracilibacillus dipsosauri]|uniref:Rha family transcriptional regulator n=1 Tax=Gracilibacillus dipsosauri TaxID=178340 RepID=UPI00240A9B43